jgi:hypothetical protein
MTPREAWLAWFREAEIAFIEAMELIYWAENLTKRTNLEMRELAEQHHGRYVERLTAYNAYMAAQEVAA